MKTIFILTLVLSLVLVTGCTDNAIVGSVVRTKEIKDMRLENCLDSCKDMEGQQKIDCEDLCYSEIAETFNDKTLCRNIVDKEMRTDCLIY